MSIDNKELYDLKYHISEYVSPRLKAFKEKLDAGKMISIPHFDEADLLEAGFSVEGAESFWSIVLENMIFPFEYHNNPEKFKKMSDDEIIDKKKKGLEYFAKYFEDLWI